jgi:chaperonin GroEL (HSP60 family)
MAESVEFNAESNANAVMTVAYTARTTLGPKGLDKLPIDQTMHRHVSNDGVTIFAFHAVVMAAEMLMVQLMTIMVVLTIQKDYLT